MALEISSTLLAGLLSEAAASPDVEVCGLFFGTAERIVAAQRCANVARDPTRSFEVDPAALLAAHRAARKGGPTIIGCYHSHPAGPALPSLRDAVSVTPDGSVWLIIGGAAYGFFRTVVNGHFHERFDPVSVQVSGELQSACSVGQGAVR